VLEQLQGPTVHPLPLGCGAPCAPSLAASLFRWSVIPSVAGARV